MNADEFREVGHRTVDLLSDYLEHIEERPLFADVEPAKLNNLFAPSQASDKRSALEKNRALLSSSDTNFVKSMYRQTLVSPSAVRKNGCGL